MSIGTYSFLPWLRQGLANQIQSADFDNTVKLRASVNVQLELRGTKLDGGSQALPVNRAVALFGPGDIVGMESRAIVRVEPRDWITNFEPNYLAHIEFYDEDMPWRYTPAAPDLGKNRLRPWIALIVLKEDEFKDGKNIKDRPLPFIDVVNLNPFPRADELWAWAHVHVNQALTNDAPLVSRDMNTVITNLQQILNKNPDLAYSRLLCPRKLAENTAYHAFVIPAFETGRRAGLGLPLGDIPATMSAWDPAARPEGLSYPYYHRWFFRTGASGDFETLVRLLVPKPVNRKVGRREMDVTFPGSGVPALDKADLKGILKLGGALQPPKLPDPPPPLPPRRDKYELWDDPFPQEQQVKLAARINEADAFQAAGHPDPIISPPLYGRWHAMMSRVLTERNGAPILPAENWVHRLNLDPRFRAAAGIGTRVVQDNQEKYMDAAWEQIGRVLDVQRKVRLGQFSFMVSDIWYDRHLKPLLATSQQKSLLMIAPLNKRVLFEHVTVHHELSGSLVQPAMTSAALRRIVRPRGRLIKSLPFNDEFKVDDLLTRVNNGEVSAAPPKETPAGVVTSENLSDGVRPKDLPSWLGEWLRQLPSLPLLLLILTILIAVIVFLLLPVAIAAGIAVVLVAIGAVLYRQLNRWAKAQQAADILNEANQTPQAIDRLPPVSDFKISAPDSGFVPRIGGADSVEASRFKEALKEHFSLVQASAGARAPKKTLDLNVLADHVTASINPKTTIPKRVLSGISIPAHVLKDIDTSAEHTFIEPMNYPIIDQPMYEPLKEKSSELFLPNINLIEINSITLLETNQRFIESYMVGLNHEFARELLWREYPTDQRGSTFRQFWDVRSFFNATNLDDEDLKEKLRDITKLHEWTTDSQLGTHDNREEGAEDEEELVLVIRGELLKRYPTAVIYAHRACWQRKPVTDADKTKDPCLRSGPIDNTQERRLVPLDPSEEAKPPRTKVLTPLYEAKVDPDIYFFGFDLTAEKAIGKSGENPNDDPGWFFVIKERPGEPRFGFDDTKAENRNVWNDLSWPEVQPKPPGSFIEIATSPGNFELKPVGPAEQEKGVQQDDDKQVAWSHGMSSAELAYILWQAPVLVAVHASEMLLKEPPKEEEEEDA